MASEDGERVSSSGRMNIEIERKEKKKDKEGHQNKDEFRSVRAIPSVDGYLQPLISTQFTVHGIARSIS